MNTTTLPLTRGGMLTAAVLVAGMGLAALAAAPPPVQPRVLEGRDRPILLARVVVTATPLSEAAGTAREAAAR